LVPLAPSGITPRAARPGRFLELEADYAPEHGVAQAVWQEAREQRKAGGVECDGVAGRGRLSVFFLGVIDPAAAFTSASLDTFGGGGAFAYNVDDIVTAVPEPGTALMLGLGLLIVSRLPTFRGRDARSGSMRRPDPRRAL